MAIAFLSLRDIVVLREKLAPQFGGSSGIGDMEPLKFALAMPTACFGAGCAPAQKSGRTVMVWPITFMDDREGIVLGQDIVADMDGAGG